MKTTFRNLSFVLASSLLLMSCQEKGVFLVQDVGEFHQAVANALPGNVIEMASGEWNNVELLFDARGTEERPVTLTVQKKGGVVIQGESNLRIAGEYLVVEGLVFKNGNTPTNEVISFRKDKGKYASHCRLTECVIDNFNNKERFETETWVAMYGRHNRVDHCYFTDKRNHGVTLTIRLVDSLCRKNHHRIDHNFFGYRQNLGANGGETLRVGTSHYSLTQSNTVVENNYFFHCDGEHEIISSKSCGHIYKTNTFFECRGTLTYRHGNDNLSEGNFFFGNGKEHTGGIRIINKRNKAINNYFYDLKGYRFRGALVIMNGVPNSPINRYHQVEGGEFLNNSFINCDHVQLCAGSDEERSLTPIDSRVSKNLFYHNEATEIFTVYDDISGIKFSENYIHNSLIPLDVTGMESVEMEVKPNDFGVYVPVSTLPEGIGCTQDKPEATPENTGVSWYPVVDKELAFDQGRRIHVEPGLNTLYDAIEESASGDLLLLEAGGEYRVNKNISITHPLSIQSAGAGDLPVLKSGKPRMFTIENGGSLKLKGLEIDGRYSPDRGGNSIVSTSKYSMNRNYKLVVEDCSVTNLDINHTFDFLKVYKNTFADSIVFRNCDFTNVTGNVMALDKETDARGIYNAEYIILDSSTFQDIQGAVLVLLRGGTDESTFGPTLRISDCTFHNVGKGKRNQTGAALYIHGSQVTSISGSLFAGSRALELYLTNGEPITRIIDCKFIDSGGIISNNQFYISQNVTYKNN